MVKPLDEDRRNAVAFLNIAAYAIPLAALVGAGTKSLLAALLVAIAAGAAVHYIMRVCHHEIPVLRGLAGGGCLFSLLTGAISLAREQGLFVLFLVVFAGCVYALNLTVVVDDEEAVDPFDDEDDHPSAWKKHDMIEDPAMLNWWLHEHHRK